MFDIMRISKIRTLFWKLGRRLYCWSRREMQNAPETNGEYWLINEAINGTSNSFITCIDIGANIGNWTARACDALSNYKKTGVVRVFEPALSTYQHLTKRFQSNELVNVYKLALSDTTGESKLYVVGELLGTNSLLESKGATVEAISTIKLDYFINETGVDNILIVKSDTEGHDMSVLRGAERSLRLGYIEIWQFEYNHRWVANHSTLKDVFDFIEDKPYRLGKLFGNGIEIYDEWHPELERYFETNYVLIRKESSVEKFCTPMRFDAGNVLVYTK